MEVQNPKEKVDGALQVLSSLDGDTHLSNAKAASLIQEVYRDGLSAKDVHQFNEVRAQFSDLIKRLPLFDEYPIKESLFNELFNSVKIVPLRFRDELNSLIEEKHFIEAEGLELSIGQQQYKRLLNEGRVTYDDRSHTAFIDVHYSSLEEEGLGLMLGKKERGIGIVE